MTTPTTAAEMVELLRRHYLPEYRQPAGIFAPEIGSPSGRRRADLIWQSLVGQQELVGHEIKVTRSDLRDELRHPEKAEDWLRYCDRWWLVVPDEKLLQGFDIPEAWGIMLPPSGRRTRSMTVLRKAPKLEPRPQAPAARRIASWLFWLQESLAVDLKAARRGEEHWREQALGAGRAVASLQAKLNERDAA